MAIEGPKTIGDASARGPKRSGGRRRRDFVVSRGMTPQASGEESHDSAVASQTIEAQPLFGQIRPHRGSDGRMGSTALSIRRTGAGMDVRTSAPQFGARKERRSAAIGEALNQKSTTDSDTICKHSVHCRRRRSPSDGSLERAAVIDVEFKERYSPAAFVQTTTWRKRYSSLARLTRK